MSRASYRQIGGSNGLLATRTPFVGNSMSATIDNGRYVVRSYNTPIASVSVTADLDPVVTDRYYSVTTSRHQNLCRAWL